MCFGVCTGSYTDPPRPESSATTRAARAGLISQALKGTILHFTKAILAAGALSLAAVSGTAVAQEAAAVEVTAGSTVYDPQGGVVGTIESVADGVAILDTGSHKVGLPFDRFGRNAEQQTTIAVTQAQLNEMAAQAAAEATAKLDAALVAGAPVVDVNGVALGSVASIEGDAVTVDTEWGAFALQKANFMAGEGHVVAQVLAEQVQATLAGETTSS